MIGPQLNDPDDEMDEEGRSLQSYVHSGKAAKSSPDEMSKYKADLKKLESKRNNAIQQNN